MFRKSATMFLFLATFAMATYAFAAQQTLVGAVTDDMCTKSHMMPGKTAAECVRACVKDGAKYTLVVGEKAYTLKGDVKQIDALAGKKAKVTGDVTGTTIAVSSITESK